MNKLGNITWHFRTIIDIIRNTADPYNYSFKVLGLIFLKYLSNTFDEKQSRLSPKSKEEIYSPDLFEYLVSDTLYLPEKTHWNFIKKNSKNPEIGTLIDEAMGELQIIKPNWKGCLPDGYAAQDIDHRQISELVEIISDIESAENDKNIWIYLFEDVMGMLPCESEKNAGAFFSSRSVIQLLVKTLKPQNGNVYDPCCGSGGMFIEVKKYMNEHHIDTHNVKYYGQEQSPDTVKIATMYLAMQDVDATISIGDTFVNDNLPDVKTNCILSNPPFNIGWPSKELRNDKRWTYGVPSGRNANYIWIQHCLSKLSPDGTAAIILPNGSLNSKSKSETNIRRKMIEAGNILCIIALPSNLFYGTIIPVSIWIFTSRKRRNDILFINAAELEIPSIKYRRELPSEDIEMISNIYHKWENGNYKDIPSLCKSIPIEEVVANSYSLVPSFYVNSGKKEEKDNIPFDEKISFLNSELSKQFSDTNEWKSPDDKMHHNLQTNKVLNEMVHTVFREWFVHFRAPWVSKIRKDTEFGLIPDDWQVMPLKKFCNFQMGYSFKSIDFKKEGEIGIIKIKNIRENFIDISATDFVDAQVVESIDRKYKVERNSLLIAMSGSDAGKVGLVPPLSSNEELWLNQRVGMFKEQIRFGNFFLYLLLSTHFYKTILRNSAIGSAQPNIGVTFINEMRVIIPPVQLIQQFGEKLYPMFEKILANNAENKELEITRKNL